MEVSFGFERLPLWRGTQNKPGVVSALPFRIGWHADGYICQTTGDVVHNQVIAAYADKDYSYITNLPGTSEWATRLGERSIEWVRRSCKLLDGKNILEIGAGNAYIAKRLVDEYDISRYVIVDPSVRATSSEKIIEIHKEYFEKNKWVKGNFDLVFGFGILEHIQDPFKLLCDLNSILLPSEGKAVLCFPNTERQLRAGDLTALIHEHLSYFTQSTATNLMERAGFEVIDCETNSDSLSMTIKAVVVPSMGGTNEMDDVLPTATNQYYRSIVQADKTIRKALMDGESVAFHGACNGLNNLLYLTGLYEDSRFHVFDGDWSKVGTYLPTCRKPILHSEDQTYREMDRIVVASTTFYSEIRDYLLEKHQICENQIISIADIDVI